VREWIMNSKCSQESRRIRKGIQEEIKDEKRRNISCLPYFARN